jgi:hypothetical protein
MAQITGMGVKRHFFASRTRAAEKVAVFNARARLVFALQNRSHAAALLDVATPPASLNRDEKKYLKPENLEMTKISLARSTIHPWHSHYSPAPRHRDFIAFADPVSVCPGFVRADPRLAAARPLPSSECGAMPEARPFRFARLALLPRQS